MSDKSEIVASLPPDQLMNRLEAGRKEMGPKIRTCIDSNERSSFTCRIDYANSFALLEARPSADGTKTIVNVEMHDVSLVNHRITVLIFIFGTLILGQIQSIIARPRTLFDWLIIPGSVVLSLVIILLLPRFSKLVLTRFIHDSLFDKTQA